MMLTRRPSIAGIPRSAARRQLLARLAATILPAGPATGAPNVLLLVADDLNCAIGPYGDEAAHAPNPDARPTP
jgi:iduronate 2-sulfatase